MQEHCSWPESDASLLRRDERKPEELALRLTLERLERLEPLREALRGGRLVPLKLLIFLTEKYVLCKNISSIHLVVSRKNGVKKYSYAGTS